MMRRVSDEEGRSRRRGGVPTRRLHPTRRAPDEEGMKGAGSSMVRVSRGGSGGSEHLS